MFAILVAVVALLTSPAYAHDLWLQKQDGSLVLYSGHRHAAHEGHKHATHEGAGLEEYKPTWVKEARCFDANGQPASFQAELTYPYRVRGECAATYVLTSSGYWTKTPYGTKNVPKAEAEMPIKSWLKYQSVKRLDRWGPALAKPLTEGLEITPREDPFTLRKGDEMHLVVTLEGRPVEGATVEYDGKPCGKSAADGTLTIRIRQAGFQMIEASLHRPDASGKADEVIREASLDFELPHER